MAKEVAVSGKTKKARKSKNFFRGTWSELKKVHWPTKKEVVKYTAVVLSTVIIMAVFFWILDMILSLGLGLVI
ncbi:MAG: preprotein translocase subunit SecE [Clostridia bacterium]|jgi:preprotein translocase subunit SecE|nr:preprotein translocase subunit SecE [Clostridia bacterium]